MPVLLELRTSIFSTDGESSKLSERFVAKWCEKHPDTEVVVRDLATDPVPHLTADRFRAFLTPKDDRTPAQVEHVEASDELIEELRSADTVVLGLPMYNFGIPSALKAWFDHVARAGVTFRYTESGSVGLIGDKPLYILAARGGLYQGTERDFQTGHVRLFFNLLGIKNIHFEYAEGLNISPESKEKSLQEAHSAIDSLI
ncbi:MAG: FMN-dependent NADH-azoreductase [Pseudomonadales bacterium]